MKAKRLIFVIMLVIVTLFSGVSSILRYADLRSALENCIEQKLETAAVMARAALPEDYHDRIVDSSSVSKEEFEKIVRGYNRLCVELGLEYLWSVMKIDGKVVFTSATSPDKDATNRKHAGFFEAHTNPGAYEAAFSTMTPQYQTIEDKWGALKSVLIPFTDARKRPCIFAACMTTRAIDLRLKRCVIESIFFGLGFLLFGAALSYALLNLLSRPIKRVIGKAGVIGPGRYGHTIILSFIVPFILLIAVITGSGGLIFSIEEVRSDAIRAMGDWNRLDASTRVRFSFHEKQKNRENWLTDIAILEETLGRLRESRATWILGEEAKACIDRTHDVWLATRKKLMEGDALFERARETDMGKRLGGMSYSMLVRSAFTGRLARSHGERQLWMLYRLQDNITNLKVSGYVLGTSLRETSDDIVGRSRLLWRLIGGVTLAASAVIVFLAFSSS
ncbi:MAG: hypothetical protein GY859_35185, partial [Desulfobacterales bacterium]|nr:hypothetical protein [Desulfobacterales bacterium]